VRFSTFTGPWNGVVSACVLATSLTNKAFAKDIGQCLTTTIVHDSPPCLKSGAHLQVSQHTHHNPTSEPSSLRNHPEPSTDKILFIHPTQLLIHSPHHQTHHPTHIQHHFTSRPARIQQLSKRSPESLQQSHRHAMQCNAGTLNVETNSTCRRMREKDIYNLSLRKHAIQQCKQQV
jgi:hypothetical protein